MPQVQTHPYNRSAPITPSDTVDIVAFGLFSSLTEAIKVGAAGTMTVVYPDNTTQQFTMVAGELLPIKVKRVNSTGTAATGLVALYTV